MNDWRWKFFLVTVTFVGIIWLATHKSEGSIMTTGANSAGSLGSTQEDSKLPSDGSKLPSSDSKLPSDDSKLPSNDSKLPSGGSQWPSNGRKKLPQISLPPQVVDGIEKIVFFVGYGRSGHTIISALLNAHPHIVIADRCFLFKRALHGEWKTELSNYLYQQSMRYYSSKTKGYSYGMDGFWKGSYDTYLTAIGSKCGETATGYYQRNKAGFINYCEELKKKLQIRVIHAVRNPFDIIATKMLVAKTHFSVLKSANSTLRWSGIEKMAMPSEVVQETIDSQFSSFKSVVEIIQRVLGEENVFEVHNCDLVSDPRETILELFKFLGIGITEQYLDACAGTIFKSVSQSRDGIMWVQDQIEMIEDRMKEFPMLSRYSFTSE